MYGEWRYNSSHKVSDMYRYTEHNYVILSGVIQRINYMFRPLYLAIIRLCLAYRVTALHTSVPNGRRNLVYSGHIHELSRMVPIFAIHILCTVFLSVADMFTL
jgi:hypothetical protein